jgi:EAL domain-containing protein (putative c-di-GMP-specific phosphodiesterase class I)
MGRNLGLEVIAEDVVTAAQAGFLNAQGCHELQRFLFSKPLPADAFEDFLRSAASRGREAELKLARNHGRK